MSDSTLPTTPGDLAHPTQLSLLPTPEVPLQFRLDAATCERGRRHVAEIQRLLEERRAAREAAARSSRTPRVSRRGRAA